MMTVEEAIKFAKYAQIMASDKGDVREFYKLAEDALKAQNEQEANKRLTQDELRDLDGDKIFIQYIGPCEGFYDDEYAPYYGRYEQYVQKYNGMLRACDLPLKYYGNSRIAYRRKPEGGDR